MSRIRPETRAAISEAQNHRCAYCSVQFGEGMTALTMDHVEPRSRGGGNSWFNLVGACWRCNAMRGDEDAYAFFAREGWRARFPGEPFLRTPTLTWESLFRGRRVTLAAVWPQAFA